MLDVRGKAELETTEELNMTYCICGQKSAHILASGV